MYIGEPKMLIIQIQAFSKIFGLLNVWMLLFGLSVIVSCKNIENKKKGRLLASVGEKELYEGDLNINFTGNNDSSGIKDRLVRDWVKKQLIFNKAMSTLSDKEKDKDRQLKDYYESLINYEYFNKMTSKNTDTSVSEAEMVQYYITNQKNFPLKGNILRLLYVKVPVSVKPNSNLKNWMRHPDFNTIPSLKMNAAQNGIAASLDTGKWFDMSEIKTDIPGLESNLKELKGFSEIRDLKYIYEINILEHRYPGENEPFILVKNKVREILANQKNTAKIKKAENDIYRDGESRKLFEIYGDKTTKK